MEYIPLKIETILNKEIFQSNHLFVEVKANDTNIRKKPSIKSESLKKVDKGNLLLLTDVIKNRPADLEQGFNRGKKLRLDSSDYSC